MMRRYLGDQEEIDAALRQFIGKLAHAGIIVKVEGLLSNTVFLPLAHDDQFELIPSVATD